MNKKQLTWLLASLGVVAVVCSTSALSLGVGQKPKGSNPPPRNGAYSALTASPERKARDRQRTAPAHDLVQAAKADYRSRNYAGAQTKIEQALAMTAPTDLWEFGSARHLLARVLIKQGRYSDALQQMNIATKSTGSERLNLDAALCLVKLSELQRARAICPTLEAVVKSINGIPKQATLTVGRSLMTASAPELEAKIHFALGYDSLLEADDAVALEEFQTAHALAPNDPVISVCLSRTLEHLKRYKEALPYLEAAHRGFAAQVQGRAKNSDGSTGMESLNSNIVTLRYKCGYRKTLVLPREASPNTSLK